MEKKAKKGEKKKGGRKWSIKIQYDDGAKEDAVFPDPEILLRPQGARSPICLVAQLLLYFMVTIFNPKLH